MFILKDIMKATPRLPSSASRILPLLGERMKLARLRRRLRAESVAERAGISRSTLWQIEKGNPSVALGAYLLVLFALGLEQDLSLVAKDDVLGRKLQDAGLPARSRVPRGKAEALP